MLLAASHKQANVRTAAEGAVIAFSEKMSVNTVPFFLKDLFKASEIGVAWQTRALALKTIASLADHAPEQLGINLPDVVPQVTLSMNETKKEVSAAALSAMTAACEGKNTIYDYTNTPCFSSLRAFFSPEYLIFQ